MVENILTAISQLKRDIRAAGTQIILINTAALAMFAVFALLSFIPMVHMIAKPIWIVIAVLVLVLACGYLLRGIWERSAAIPLEDLRQSLQELASSRRVELHSLGHLIRETKDGIKELIGETGDWERAVSEAIIRQEGITRELAGENAEPLTHIKGGDKIIDAIAGSIGECRNSVPDLQELSKGLEVTLGGFENISENLKLIAFNATIEAAGAGEAGDRFEAIAKEMRSQSAGIASTTENLKQSLTQFNLMLKDTRIKLQGTASEIENGLGTLDNALQSAKDAFKGIDAYGELSEELKTHAGDVAHIRRLTEKLHSHLQEMGGKFEDLERVG